MTDDRPSDRPPTDASTGGSPPIDRSTDGERSPDDRSAPGRPIGDGPRAELSAFEAVSFDLFGTLVDVDAPDDPAAAVAAELDARGVSVPDDWAEAYAEPHVDAPEGAEVPLPAHVHAALSSRDVAIEPGDAGGNVVRRAVVAAFDPDVRTREGATRAVEAAAARGPVAVLSNCSAPEIAGRALLRSDVDRDAIDAVVTSVGCGWRKPDGRAFEAVARRLGVPATALLHVGDDPRTDGGASDAGAASLLIGDVPLAALPRVLEES